MTIDTETILTNDQLNAFIAELDDFCDQHRQKHYPNSSRTTHTWSRGQKYIRIIAHGGSCYCFLKMNGDILKSESWTRPAKHVRGNILTDDNYSLGKGLSTYGAVYLR